MFALATLVFAACSDDHAISDGNSDVVTDPSGDAWVALPTRFCSLAFVFLIIPCTNGAKNNTKTICKIITQIFSSILHLPNPQQRDD